MTDPAMTPHDLFCMVAYAYPLWLLLFWAPPVDLEEFDRHIEEIYDSPRRL